MENQPLLQTPLNGHRSRRKKLTYIGVAFFGFIIGFLGLYLTKLVNVGNTQTQATGLDRAMGFIFIFVGFCMVVATIVASRMDKRRPIANQAIFVGINDNYQSVYTYPQMGQYVQGVITPVHTPGYGDPFPPSYIEVVRKDYKLTGDSPPPSYNSALFIEKDFESKKVSEENSNFLANQLEENSDSLTNQLVENSDNLTNLSETNFSNLPNEFEANSGNLTNQSEANFENLTNQLDSDSLTIQIEGTQEV